MSAARCASPLSWAPRAAAALLITLAWLATVGAAQSEPTFPVLTSRITDQAGLLSADDYTAIQAELASLRLTGPIALGDAPPPGSSLSHGAESLRAL